MSAERQLVLDLIHPPALGAEDFLVAEPNREAVAWIQSWPTWPAPVLVIHGPAGCGKTHLTRIFQGQTGARSLVLSSASDVDWTDASDTSCSLFLDDADAALTPATEETLLHVLNTLREAGRHLLLTGLRPPAQWPVGLPDLHSRLAASMAVAIAPPDDGLLRAVLVKLFTDCGLRVDESVISYLVPRLERTFDAARGIVNAIEGAAIHDRRRITVPLVRSLLRTEGS
ncbi:MAG: hypothetical protein EA405_10960 [Rhodospirillales bacterium]|nr:MAG: hypothetical protein EA405_10960 [Rhodospirillales bacterium]